LAAGAAALALAVAALTGCGGGEPKVPDSKAAGDAVTGFAKAFASGDGAKACDLLTTGARAAFVKRAQTATGSKDCAGAMKRVHDLAGSSVTGPFATATVSGVKVSGATATATLTAAGHSATVNLAVQDGAWKLTGVPGIQ
jgi:hypothetical protein